jgi:hypothetical protein
MPMLGIPLRETVTEANRAYWRKLPAEPQKWIEWIVRGHGDPVDDMMRAYPLAFNDFELLWQETFPREGTMSIYRRRAGTAGLRPPASCHAERSEGSRGLASSLRSEWPARLIACVTFLGLGHATLEEDVPRADCTDDRKS